MAGNDYEGTVVGDKVFWKLTLTHSDLKSRLQFTP